MMKDNLENLKKTTADNGMKLLDVTPPKKQSDADAGKLDITLQTVKAKSPFAASKKALTEAGLQAGDMRLWAAAGGHILIASNVEMAPAKKQPGAGAPVSKAKKEG